MAVNSKCRFALHLGLNSVSFVKIARDGDAWRLLECGEHPWSGLTKDPIESEKELTSVVKEIAKEHGVTREPVHVSLHSRFCVSRVVTGSRQQVQDQLEEIATNSHHYLQLGQGDKLLGSSKVELSDGMQYGQVTIIKRGLIASIENAAHHASLELQSVDGAMPCTSRFAGFAGLDSTEPLLLVWLEGGSAEIGISYQGRLQLSYHLGGKSTPEQVATTIEKHLKRLKRFCGRYRNVAASAELRHVLIFASGGKSQELRERLSGHGFEKVFTLRDLQKTSMSKEFGNCETLVPGVGSALGGLLTHVTADVLPTTDIFEQYVDSKPRSLLDIVVRDGMVPLMAMALLLIVLATGWWIKHEVKIVEEQCDLFTVSFASERDQVLELDAARKELTEYRRLQHRINYIEAVDLVRLVAQCLPADTRLDWFGFDTSNKLVLKGTMLKGDQTYEVLKSLRDTSVIEEVALESVGKASNFGQSATLFEIHCQLSEEAAKSDAQLSELSQPGETDQ